MYTESAYLKLNNVTVTQRTVLIGSQDETVLVSSLAKGGRGFFILGFNPKLVVKKQEVCRQFRRYQQA